MFNVKSNDIMSFIKNLQVKKDHLIYVAVILLSIQFYDEIPFLYWLDQTKVKHLLVIAVCAIGILPDLNGTILKIKRFQFELKHICFVTASLVIISFVYMYLNGFSSGWISESYYLLMPAFFTYAVFKDDCSVQRVESIMNTFLFTITIGYISVILQRVASDNLTTISFINSSSPFEIECAHLYLLLYIFYMYIDNRAFRILSGICCVLAWKRMCLLYLVFVTIIYHFTRRDKPVSKWLIVGLSAITVAMPVLLNFLLTDSFSKWFTDATGLDLNKVMMFRYQTIVTAFNSQIPSKGLGSFLTVDVPWYGENVHISIHNDAVRLYLEVSPIGLLIFSAGMSSLGKSYDAFWVVLYLFIEMIVSHFLGNGSLPFWIIAYSLIFFFNENYSQKQNEVRCGN